MNITGDLIALEEQFWKGDADFYRQRLTAEALMVFPDPLWSAIRQGYRSPHCRRG